MATRARWIIAGICGIAAAVTVLSRFEWRRSAMLETVASQESRARDTYADLKYVPLASLGDQEFVRSALANLRVEGEPLPPELKASLDRDLAAFLERRFGSGGPAAYRAWMASRGCVLKPVAELNKRKELSAEFPFFFGTQMPADVQATDLFDRFWEATARHAEGLNQPSRIAGGSEGFALTTSRWTAQTARRQTIRGEIPEELWQCTLSANMRNWFVPPVTREQLVARDGHAWCAEFGFMMEYQNKSRRPMVAGFFYDPDRKVWHPEFMNSHFFDRSQVVTALGF